MDATPDTVAEPSVAVIAGEAVRTPWAEFWRKFKQQQVALFAGGFVVFARADRRSPRRGSFPTMPRISSTTTA